MFPINKQNIKFKCNSICDCIGAGKKIVLFGNGGSAADSQHIAAEFLGRFLEERARLKTGTALKELAKLQPETTPY